MCLITLGKDQLDLGDLEGAERALEGALRLSQKNNAKVLKGSVWIWLARTPGRKESPKIDRGEECFSKGLGVLQEVKMQPFYSLGLLFLVEFDLDVGKKVKAFENLKKAEANFQEMSMDYWLDRTQEVLGRV